MNEKIANQNSERLANLSIIFCLSNGIMPDEQLVHVLSCTVMSNIAKWYDERGRNFNPAEELIEDDAIIYAFKRVQVIATLAQISAQTGIGMDGFED